MIKRNQRLINQINILMDGCLVVLAYVLGCYLWLDVFKGGAINMADWANGHVLPLAVVYAGFELLLLMLFIILNQIFQSELGFIPLRDNANFFDINFKNSSYIWGPGENDAIGSFLALFTPSFFKTVPVGEFAGQIKYWPWFWMIVPAYVLVTPLSFGLSMIFDSHSLKNDWRTLKTKLFTKTSPAIKSAGE